MNAAFVLGGLLTLASVIGSVQGIREMGAATPVLSFLVVGFSLRRIPRWRRFGSWLLLGSPLTLSARSGGLTTPDRSEFTKHALIDEYWITANPVVLGQGIS
jgi:hypothetical protein